MEFIHRLSRIHRKYSAVYHRKHTNPRRRRKEIPAFPGAVGFGKSAVNRGVWRGYPHRSSGWCRDAPRIERKWVNYTKFSVFHSHCGARKSVGFVGNGGGRRWRRAVDKQAFPREGNCGKPGNPRGNWGRTVEKWGLRAPIGWFLRGKSPCCPRIYPQSTGVIHNLLKSAVDNALNLLHFLKSAVENGWEAGVIHRERIFRLCPACGARFSSAGGVACPCGCFSFGYRLSSVLCPPSSECVRWILYVSSRRA